MSVLPLVLLSALPSVLLSVLLSMLSRGVLRHLPPPPIPFAATLAVATG